MIETVRCDGFFIEGTCVAPLQMLKQNQNRLKPFSISNFIHIPNENREND